MPVELIFFTQNSSQENKKLLRNAHHLKIVYHKPEHLNIKLKIIKQIGQWLLYGQIDLSILLYKLIPAKQILAH